MNAIALLTTLVLFFQNQAAPIGPPELKFAVKPTRDAVVPGETIDILLELNLSPPYHMYHAILLDTGFPTAFTFDAPAGITIGDIRFPRPRLSATAGIEALELTGKFYCVASLRVDPGASPGPVEIKANVSGLACVEACVPVSASTTFSINVTKAAGSAINTDLLEKAVAALPPALSDAPHIKGSRIEPSKSKYKVGDAGELLATIQVEKGHHIQDRDPGAPGLVGLRFFIEPVDGIEIAKPDKQIWPEPKVTHEPGVGTLRTLAGNVAVRIPFKITDSKFASGPVALRVLVQYQVCTDAGQCYPPEMAATVVHFDADTPNPLSAARQQQVLLASEVGTVTPPPAKKAASDALSLLGALLFAFLGGILLNVMPCVLPVISIKIVSFVDQAHADPRRVFRLGLAFCLGIMVWFWMLAGIVGGGSATLRATFQNPFQSPGVVFGVATVIFVMALNMFGVFEFVLPGAAAGRLEDAARKEGYPGAFMKGFLATLLGTACSAPFLAVAMAFAVTQPFHVGFLIFTLAGLGMALPYLLLCANPKWLAFVPKPGLWMVTFKQAMGFIILATAVWLLWVLRKQIQVDGVVAVIVFWSFLAFGAWLLGLIKPGWHGFRTLTTTAAAVLIVAGGSWFAYAKIYKTEAAFKGNIDEIVKRVMASDWETIPWVAYSPGLADAIAQKGYTVYVDYTADWCGSCKVNLASSINVESTRALMKELRVIPIEADYTSFDSDMRRDIETDKQISVPVNRVYRPGGGYTVLPTVLTPGIVHDALRDAGASTAASQPALAARPLPTP